MNMPDFIIFETPMEYKPVLYFQRKLVDLRNNDKIDDTFIFLEHNDVYTAGVHYRGNDDIIRVERGGYETYHGPGQLVVYFIINLRERKMNALDLIKKIQNSVVNTLKYYNIESYPMLNEKTGVWHEDRKICSIGIAIRGFSTFHGMALNVNTDLSKFNRIMPCNFSPDIMTSMERISGRPFNINSVRERLIQSIEKEFDIKEKNIYKNVDLVGYGNGLLP
ncbi:lipoyl(octanoyl) transferase [Picrophilus oshimae DSM 9789]|nr:lipoyl(octanoyl) transferase [Picrophilus oshimae DSM 9789]